MLLLQDFSHGLIFIWESFNQTPLLFFLSPPLLNNFRQHLDNQCYLHIQFITITKLILYQLLLTIVNSNNLIKDLACNHYLPLQIKQLSVSIFLNLFQSLSLSSIKTLLPQKTKIIRSKSGERNYQSEKNETPTNQTSSIPLIATSFILSIDTATAILWCNSKTCLQSALWQHFIHFTAYIMTVQNKSPNLSRINVEV